MEAARRKPSWRTAAVAGIGLLHVLWSLVFIWRSSFTALDGTRYFCLFDDAMISMRYAHNLAHGAGLVWNAGERVEGYSNFLMVLFMAAASAVFDKREAVLAVQVLGIAFMLAIAWTVMRIMDRVMEREGGPGRHAAHPVYPVLAMAATLAYYPLNYWTLMGMETGLLTLILALAASFSLDFARTRAASRAYAVAVLMGLAFMTRIDSLIFGLPIALYLIAAAFRPDPFPAGPPGRPSSAEGAGSPVRILPALGGPLLVFALMVAGHEAFRLSYYGELLPNTYSLKLTGMPAAWRMRDGWAFIQPFLGESAALMLAALGALVLKPGRERAFLAGLGTLAVAYQVWNGGDPWDYWRIPSPGMPFLILLSILGWGGLPGAMLRFLPQALLPAPAAALARSSALAAALAALGMAAALWKADRRFRLEWTFRSPPKYADNHRNLVNNSLALAAVTDSSATLGVFWAGTAPYYTGRRAFDFLGKSDPRIARLAPDTSGRVAWNHMRSVPGHNKYDLEYSIKALRPTYAEGFRWGTQDLEPWAGDRYATLVYQGVSLRLLKDSPAVRWDKADTVIGGAGGVRP